MAAEAAPWLVATPVAAGPDKALWAPQAKSLGCDLAVAFLVDVGPDISFEMWLHFTCEKVCKRLALSVKIGPLLTGMVETLVALPILGFVEGFLTLHTNGESSGLSLTHTPGRGCGVVVDGPNGIRFQLGEVG